MNRVSRWRPFVALAALTVLASPDGARALLPDAPPAAAEALNYVTAAANLAWRRVGQTYVIAPADSLRAMTEQFGDRMTVPLTALSAPDAVSIVTSALPYLTARPAGTSVLLIGAPEDLTQA